MRTSGHAREENRYYSFASDCQLCSPRTPFNASQENCRRQRAALQAAIAALEDGTDDADLARLLEIEETFEEVGVSSQRVNLSDVVCLSVGLSGLSLAFLFVDARASCCLLPDR